MIVLLYVLYATFARFILDQKSSLNMNQQNLLAALAGFIWTEIKQMWDGGFQDYMHDWWNLMDFVMNSLYLATISLKIVAYVKVCYITTITGGNHLGMDQE